MAKGYLVPFVCMRLRIVIIVTLTVAAYAAAVLVWRQMFPFRDGLAEFLPEGTIAYVHVNLTSAVRRQVEFQISNSRFQIYEPIVDALTTALRSRDVRDLGFVWYKPDAFPQQLALIIGQRASSRPDVVPVATFTVGGQEVRTFVVRIRSSDRDPSALLRSTQDGVFTRKLRRHPVQVVLRPRELPIPALEAARHLLPETVTASGTVGRRGFVLRSDGRIPSVMRSTRTELLAEPRPGTLQIIGLQVRAIAEQLDLPFHKELRVALEPFLPERADVLIEGGHIAVRMPAPTTAPSEAVLRSLAARIWPITRARRLDGLPAEVLVADPDALTIVQSGPNRWMLRAKEVGTSKIFAEQSGEFVYLASEEGLLGAGEGGGVRFLAPTGASGLEMTNECRLDDQLPFIIWHPHPQAVVTMGVDPSGSSAALCGRILRPGN